MEAAQEVEVLFGGSFIDAKNRFGEICILWESNISHNPTREETITRVMPKLVHFFNGCLQELKEIGTERDSEANSDSVLVKDLQCIAGVLKCIGTCHSNLSMPNDMVKDVFAHLVDATVEIVLKSCNHYADRNSVYKDLETFQYHLDELYSQAVDVVNKFVHTMELWQGNLNWETDRTLLISVCEAICDICEVIASFDVKTTVSLWKLYTKLTTVSSEWFYDQVDVSRALNLLCREIVKDINFLSGNNYHEKQGDDIKLCVQTIRLSGFCLKIVVRLCGSFKNCLAGCFQSIIQLLLHISRISPPCLTRPVLPKILADEVTTQLVVAVEPLVGHLISEKKFARGLMSMASDPDPANTFQFPLCMLLTVVLDNLFSYEEDVQDLWMTNNGDGLVDALFKIIPCCYVELSLPVKVPGVMVKGKPQRLVSLYEHICTKLCGFITCLPAKYFSQLEMVLFENVLSKNLWVALMASDAWAFLARLESAELCFHHCWQIASLSAEIECEKQQNIMLLALLRRLTSFLDTEHKAKLLTQFPHLLSTLEEADLSDPAMNMLTENLVNQKSNLLTDIERFCHQSPDSTKFYDLVKRLVLLQPPICELDSRELEIVLLFWKMVPLNSLPTTISVAEWAFESILKIISTSVNCVSSDRFSKFLLNLQDLYMARSEVFRISVIWFLGLLGKRTFQSCDKRKAVLGGLSKVLTATLEESNVIVHQFALETFSQFATETVHAEVIPFCIKHKPWLKPEISNYFSQVPYILSDKLDLQLEHQKRFKIICTSAVQVAESAEHSLNSTRSLENIGNGKEEPENIIQTTLENISQEIDNLELLAYERKLTHSQQEFVQILSTKLTNIGTQRD